MQISKSVDNIIKNARTVNNVLPKYDDIYLMIVHDDEEEGKEEEKKDSVDENLHFLFIHKRFSFVNEAFDNAFKVLTCS